jgi:hypothetical protein
MRLQRQIVLLKFQLRAKNFDNFKITAYDRYLDNLSMNQYQNDDILTFELWITLSNQILLEFSNIENTTVELVNMSLAMIPIDKKVLANIIEYKRYASIIDFQQVPSEKTLVWDHNGCVLFNIFSPNPLAYHLSIGNKIKVL